MASADVLGPEGTVEGFSEVAFSALAVAGEGEVDGGTLLGPGNECCPVRGSRGDGDGEANLLHARGEARVPRAIVAELEDEGQAPAGART